jgi:hypothetical protein
MHKNWKINIVLLLSSLLFLFSIRCKKEYSYEGGPLNNGSSGGTAKYTLSGDGGNCTGITVFGNYYSATILSASNTVTLEANVTVPGSYSLTTNTSDGISFSTSGTFVNTGLQAIILAGTGIPVSKGNFVFTPPVGAGCSYTIQVKDAPPVQAQYNFAGAPNGCTSATVNGTYISGVALTNVNTTTITTDVVSIGDFKIYTDTIDGISFSKSGKFTKTGIQTVTLNGSGIPEMPQNISFILSGGTSSCSFNASVRNPDPLGVYVLESGFGSPSPCVSFVINGIYKANTPLNNANTISVKVTVTVAGNFTISTNTVNGIYFSYTGAFSAPGPQLVVLAGQGTPLAAGVFSFTPQIVGPAPIGGSACAIDLTVQ